MKKVLAIILSAALLITALAVNVVAASATGTATGTFSGTFTANDYDSGMSTVTGSDVDIDGTWGGQFPDITKIIEKVAPLEDVTHIKVTVTANDITPCWGGEGTSPRVELRWNNRAGTNAMTATFETTSGTAGQAVVYGDVPTGTTAVVLNPFAFNDQAESPIEFSVTVEVTYEEQGKVRIGDEYFDTLVEAVDAANDGDTIYLLDNVKVHEMVNITVPNVILDLGGFTLTAADDFSYSMKNKNDAHVINISADGVTVRNGIVKATAKNKHAINVYRVDGAVLENVTADHTDSTTGAPIVIGGSDVTVKGRLTTITGTNSWYAINVDSYAGMESNITFAQNSTVAFEGVSPLGIYIETNSPADTDDVTVTFEKNVSVTAPEGVSNFTAVATAGSAENAEVVNPENAGLKDNGDGTYGVAPIETSKKITGCVYLNEDYHALIVNGRFIAQPHVDNGTGFCVACKGAINK